MERLKFPVVLVASTLGFLLGLKLGFGTRVYTDLVGRYEVETAMLRGMVDYFILGSIVYLFGGVAAKLTKTGPMFVFVSALLIWSFDVSRWELAVEPLFLINLFRALLAYYAGVFAVYGAWTFASRAFRSFKNDEQA